MAEPGSGGDGTQTPPQLDLETLTMLASESMVAIGATQGVHAVIMLMIEQLTPVAWIKLGLRPNPVDGATKADLTEARVAIDVITGLAAFLTEKLDDKDRRQVQSIVADLKANYVNQAGAQS